MAKIKISKEPLEYEHKTFKFFVYGLSGSGKDTVANMFRDEYDFIKLRIAGTIKQIICEQKNIPFSKLDIIKREQPELRKLHNTTGDFMDEFNGTETRIKQIINLDSVDCDIIPNIKEQDIFVCDVRTKKEASLFLNAGFFGIFLSRSPNSEFRDLNHHTEKDMFINGDLLELIKTYNTGYNMLIVLNNDKEDNSLFIDKLLKIPGNVNCKIITTNGKPERLKYMIREILENEIEKIEKI